MTSHSTSITEPSFPATPASGKPEASTTSESADPEKALSASGPFATILGDFAELAHTLDLGDEYFWTPDRLVPFEHWVGHIPFVFWLMKIVRPGRFVELGTHRGNSYCAMCQAVERLRLDAVGTAVDTWEGDIHMHREVGLLEELKAYHDPRYGAFSTLHRATFDEARSYFSNGSVDLLHIDGTHTYDAVRHDFELWLPTLSERGVVLFHDTEVRRDNFGVWRLWEELSKQYPAFTFAHSNGLGILGVGKDQPSSFRALLRMAQRPREAAFVRNLFAVRGSAIVDRLVSRQLNEEVARAAKAAARQLEEANDALDRLREEDARAAEAATQQLAEANAALDRLREEEARAAEAATQQLAEANAALDRLREEEARAAEAAAQQLAAAKDRVAAVEQRNSELDRSLADARAQLALAIEARHQAASSVNAITTSTTWRATAPLRNALSSRPRLARLVRRLMKAAWWTLTGQLPARLRARQDALAALKKSSTNDDPTIQVPATDGSTIEAPTTRLIRAVPRYIDPADTWRDPPASIRSRIAVHLHVFYFDLLDEFISRLKSIPIAFDLFVSIPECSSTSQAAQVERALREGILYASQIVVKPVPNRGRDIAPFIAEFGGNLLDYDIIGHFHTKKSPHNAELASWLDTILDLLLGPAGNPGGHVSSIFAMLEKDVKIVYPEGPLAIPREATGWAGNHAIAQAILAKYTDVSIFDFPTVEFPEGMMLWARSSAIKKFLELPLAYNDFPAEPIGPDGSLAHALERLVFILAQDVEGDLVRLCKGGSIADHRFFEEALDFSNKLVHTDVKVLAYYLPQFHPTPENDEWHGIGFTEWTKVRSASPLFYGHYQQHIPHPDFGYYHLDGPEVLRRQASDMKRAGVYGQIFYHYWFTGRLILERPAQMLLKNTDIDMPFCFCWANENWTRRWDGSEDQILLKQDYSADDALAFIRYLIPFFNDPRYIKIEGRPVLFVYRPILIRNIATYLAIWREECEAAGLARPYVVATLAGSATDPRDFEMDAAVERVLYDWTNGRVPDITSGLDAYMPLQGRVFSYESMKDYYSAQPAVTDFTYFRSLVPNWDNTARYGDRAHVLHGSTPRLFQEWLEVLIAQTKRTLLPDRQFIVVNAWNEWAEGAHLEADTRYGYSYLNAIGRALANEPYSEPARDSFHALAIADAAKHARDAGAIMMVTHRWGGGTERHVDDMVKALAREGLAVFMTRVATDRPDWVVVERADRNARTELGAFFVGANPDDYARLLRRLHVKLLHVQHLAGFPEAAADWIQRACATAEIDYDVTLHDYMAVCPRIVMVTESNKYCNEPPLSQCEICITSAGSPFGRPSVADWRSRYGRLLVGARRCFVPSDDAAERLSRYFPKVNFTVRAHPEPRRNDARLKAQESKLAEKASGVPASLGGKQHVVVIGHISGHKGFNILLECARFAQKTQAPIRFTIIGATDRDSDFDALENVTILGRYEPSEFLDIVERQSPNIAFLPSSCPETYSFTLSETVAAGVYPVVFDLGAMGKRVRSLGWGDVLPAAWINNPEAVVKALLEATPARPTPAVYELARGASYPNLLRDYYDLEWQSMSAGVCVENSTRPVSDARLREVSFVAPDREAALYVTYSPDGHLKPHVQRCVSAIAAAGIRVYLIVAADFPTQTYQFDDLRDAAGVFIRHNEGYDFAAWAHVIQEHPEFKVIDTLYLVNDSVVGPLNHDDFLSAIARVRGSAAEVCGMTENFEQGWHLQSYFLAIKQPALGSGAFDEFFGSVVSLRNKQAVIENYEISFASKMEKAGFRVEALFTFPSERNVTIYHWEELVHRGFPFVKIQIARDEIAGVDRKRVRRFLENAGYSSVELSAILGKRPGQ